VKPVPTVGELKAHCAQVRACLARSSALGEYPVVKLLSAIEGLPGDVTFCTTDLLGQVVSRALVEKAFQALNDGPGSAGIGKALVLLREALG